LLHVIFEFLPRLAKFAVTMQAGLMPCLTKPGEAAAAAVGTTASWAWSFMQ
jgi:hypothetical protein